MKNIIKIAIALVGATLLGACANDEGIYLNLSDSSVSLDGAGYNEVTIEVSASSSWSYTINDSWITFVNKDSNGLTVKGEAYYGSDTRVGSITFETDDMIVKTTVFQLSSLVTMVNTSIFTQGEPSPSGYYVAGMYYPDDYYANPTLIDMRTGETTYFDLVDNDYVVSCVDDNGNIFLNSSWMTDGMRVDATTGVAEAIEVPDGYSAGGVNAVSADGSVWVGYACIATSEVVDGFGSWYPMKWVNGVPELLPSSEYNGTGVQYVWYGVVARGCSDDGSIIYGSIMDFSESVYWTADNEYKIIAEEMVEFYETDYTDNEFRYYLTAGARCYADNQRISPNGKYLSFRYVNDTEGTQYPGYLDIETEVLYLMTDYSGYDIMTLTDDLDIVLYSSSSYLVSTTMLLASGEKMSTNDWLEENYGLQIEDDRAVMQIGSNGTVFGWEYSNYTYIPWWLQFE
ncbi:MAG: BACON domain-containing protein [Rikenellaceae bacterium]